MSKSNQHKVRYVCITEHHTCWWSYVPMADVYKPKNMSVIYAVIKTCNVSSQKNGFLQAINAILCYYLSSFHKAAT